MNKTGIALIGTGYWGTKIKQYLGSNRYFELFHVCNSKSDLSEIWNDVKTKAVMIAVPNQFHYQVARKALWADKYVFCEKPLTLSSIECNELKQIASDHKLKLCVEYTYTFSKGLQRAKHLVDEGFIGKILGIEMAVRHLGRFGGGSVYWLLGSHMLSVLDMFVPLNTLEFWANPFVKRKGSIETGAIGFKNDSVMGEIVVSLNYTGKETRVIIYGEKGTLTYNPLDSTSLKFTTYKRLDWAVADKLQQKTMKFYFDEANNIGHALEYFHKVLIGKAESNIDRAIEITKILENL